MAELTDTHRAVLDFERTVWKYAGAKATAIRERFGWTETRYYQVVTWLIEQPEALAYDAQTVRRLGRLAQARRVQRSGSVG